MSECPDNQDVGSEAATIQRVRNSSLVECTGAENVTGLKHTTEASGSERIGRGALYVRRSGTVRSRGAHRRENAGMSKR